MSDDQHYATRAEQAAEDGSSASGHPVADFVRNSPFLFVSLVFHLIVLALLAFITTREPEPPMRRISITMDPVEQDPVQPRPVPHLPGLPEAGVKGPQGSDTPDEGQKYEDIVKNTPQVDIPTVDAPHIHEPVAPGDPEQFEEQGPDDLKRVTPKAQNADLPNAVDVFAVSSINAIAEGRTLVVLMIDRSRSVIYGDLPRLIDLMDRYFEQIGKELPARLRGRGQWQVVSFGDRPRFVGKPSSNLSYVKQALGGVKVDPSGRENLGAAVEAVLKRHGNGAYKHILIGAMTDEAGDDVQDPVTLARVIKRMRKNNARFYAFGYESVFGARRKRVHLKLDPERIRAVDRKAIRGFEGETIHGWANGGPDSPRPELWWGSNWRRWHHWGATLNSLPSGFGMYTLNRMALYTGGTYFMLEMESDYDQDKLYAKYKPDICSTFEYDKRMSENPLRHALAATWEQIGTFYLDHDLRSEKEVSRMLREAVKGRNYCIRRAGEIHHLAQTSVGDRHNRSRWLAHAELTRAELLRLRFMLGQYHQTLKKARANYGGELRRREKRIIIHRGRAPQDYHGPAQAKREHDLALQHIELTIERHRGTPWAVLGQRMKRGLHPWKASLKDTPEPRPADHIRDLDLPF